MSDELDLKRLGGSDAGPVLNNSPRHALDVWLRITRDLETPGDAFYRDLGKWAEPRIVAEVQDLYGVTVEKPATTERGDHFRFSPDGIIKEWGDLLEVKFRNPFMRDQYGEPGTDEVPEHEKLQVQFYLEMLDGPETGHLAAAFGGPRPVMYRIDRATAMETAIRNLPQVQGGGQGVQPGRDLVQILQQADKEAGKRIVEAMSAWYERHVVKGEMPALDGAASSTLNLIWAKDTGLVVQASPEDELDMRLLRQLKKTMDRAKDVKEALEGRIKQKIADGSALEGREMSMTWKRSRDTKAVDYEAAFVDLLSVCGLHGLKVDGEKILADHTKARIGNRPLLGPKEKKK